jgi:hypothetical protein
MGQNMGMHRNKLTDLQRTVHRTAMEADPGKRVVSTQYALAANLLAMRGYISLSPCGDGFRVEVSDWAARNRSCHTWRRFPPLKAPPPAGCG